MRSGIRKIVRILLFLIVSVIFISTLFKSVVRNPQNYLIEIREEVGQYLEEKMIGTHLPLFAFARQENELARITEEFIKGNSPLWEIIEQQSTLQIATESNHEIDELIRREGMDEDSEDIQDLTMNQDSEGIIKIEGEIQDKLLEENNLAKGENSTVAPIESSAFTPILSKKQEYQWDYYENQEKLIQDFYAIDASTEVLEGQLDVKKLLEKDMTLSGDNTKPQILIYHTHSQEGFADSVAGDDATTIMGAGEYLTGLLQDTYGFHVLHHTGKYDVETRDYAYSEALPNIETLLAQNPSIEVVIDLHRDAVSDPSKKLVATINGKECAQFMFFNGLSRTKKQGNIEYLKNPYIQDNLAFSFQMQALCNGYYPGVTRRIYLKGYRYNMHLCPKTLLIEMGAQTNTQQEIYNSLDILAHVLAMELAGEDEVNEKLKQITIEN